MSSERIRPADPARFPLLPILAPGRVQRSPMSLRQASPARPCLPRGAFSPPRRAFAAPPQPLLLFFEDLWVDRRPVERLAKTSERHDESHLVIDLVLNGDTQCRRFLHLIDGRAINLRLGEAPIGETNLEGAIVSLAFID